MSKLTAREPGSLFRKLMISEAELIFYRCYLLFPETGSCALGSRVHSELEDGSMDLLWEDHTPPCLECQSVAHFHLLPEWVEGKPPTVS